MHLQNLYLQEKIKRLRYAKNSTIKITPENVNTAPGDFNLLEAVSSMHKCQAELWLSEVLVK